MIDESYGWLPNNDKTTQASSASYYNILLDFVVWKEREREKGERWAVNDNMFKSVVVCNGVLHCSSFAAEDIDLMLSKPPFGRPAPKKFKVLASQNSAPYIITA